MKRLRLIILLLLLSTAVYPQYYIKGDVKDDKGIALQNVGILLHSTNILYRTGTFGGFGITTSRVIDTASFSLDGYQTITTKINATEYLHIQMKALVLPASIQKSHLNNFVKDINNNYPNWTIKKRILQYPC